MKVSGRNYFWLVLVAFHLSKAVYTQENELHEKSYNEVEYVIITSTDDTSVYHIMYRSIVANQAITYFTYPYIRSEFENNGLREGEGKHGYTFEAILDNVFTLLQGRDRSIWDFLRTSRVTLHANIGMRMTEDESRPLIPSNYKVGLGYNKSVWDSQSKWHINPCKSANRDAFNETKGLHSLHLLTLAEHFSNGQQPGFFYVDSVAGINRNDYLDGDFSTSYMRLSLLYNYHGRKKSLASLGTGYQWDLGGDSTILAYIHEMNEFYGRQRLHLFGQYRFISGMFPRFPLELMARVELEYITDDISVYHDKRGIQQRWSSHLYLCATPIESRSLGLVAHFYYGRDYFNIRFDDVILTAQVGLTFTMDKYYPPGVTNDGVKIKKRESNKVVK